VGLDPTIREDGPTTTREEDRTAVEVQMKCPQCNTYTEVLETRLRSDGVVRRRYLCANMHRFATLEVVVEDRKTKEKNT